MKILQIKYKEIDFLVKQNLNEEIQKEIINNIILSAENNIKLFNEVEKNLEENNEENCSKSFFINKDNVVIIWNVLINPKSLLYLSINMINFENLNVMNKYS